MEDDPRLKGEGGKKLIKEKFSKELDCAHYILNTALRIIDHSKSITDVSISQQVLLLLHAKAYATFQAIIILCEKGFGRDALILDRSILEILFNISYILKEGAEEMSKYYIYHDTIEAERFRAKSINHASEEQGKTMEELLKKRIAMIPEVDKKYIDKKTNPFSKSVKFRAEKCDMKAKYDVLYSYLSNLPHSTSKSLESYIKGNIKDTLRIRSGMSNEKIEEALNYACQLYIEILDQWCNHLNISEEEKRRSIRERYLKTFWANKFGINK